MVSELRPFCTLSYGRLVLIIMLGYYTYLLFMNVVVAGPTVPRQFQGVISCIRA